MLTKQLQPFSEKTDGDLERHQTTAKPWILVLDSALVPSSQWRVFPAVVFLVRMGLENIL